MDVHHDFIWFDTFMEQVFRVKKITRGAPMGRPKLELRASNGVHICHAIYHGPSNS